VVLLDTSCWVHALRRRPDPRVRDRVTELLAAGEAAWCDVVRLELWNGVASDVERRWLSEMARVLPSIPITPEVWEFAIELAGRARSRGLTIPATDLLIFSCGRCNSVPIEHRDSHFDSLATLFTR